MYGIKRKDSLCSANYTFTHNTHNFCDGGQKEFAHRSVILQFLLSSGCCSWILWVGAQWNCCNVRYTKVWLKSQEILQILVVKLAPVIVITVNAVAQYPAQSCTIYFFQQNIIQWLHNIHLVHLKAVILISQSLFCLLFSQGLTWTEWTFQKQLRVS